LERVLKEEKYKLSVEKTSELTLNMYQMTITLHESRHTKNIILKMEEDQTELVRIVNKNFSGDPLRKTGVNITLERLYQLAEILETPVQNILPESHYSCTFNVSNCENAISATIYNNYQDKDMTEFMKNMVSMFHELAVKEKR